MASTPLLSSGKSAASKGKNTIGKNIFLEAADLESGIESVKQITPWDVWRSEDDHRAMVSKMDYVISMVTAANSQWANTTSEARYIAILCRLETTLSASEGVPEKALLMLADEIEKVLPVVTTQADMQELLEKFVSLVDTPTPFNGMTVETWCDCVLIPHSPKTKPNMGTYKEKLDEFQNWIGERSISMKKEYYSKHGEGSKHGTKLPTMAECLRKGLGSMFTAGHFEVLTKKNLMTRTFSAMKKKKALQWTAFGPALCAVLQECNLPEQMFNSTPEHKDCLEQVRDVVLPNFLFNLFRLKGLFERQLNSVETLKARFLAGMMSAALAGGQLLATYSTHMLQEEQ